MDTDFYLAKNSLLRSILQKYLDMNLLYKFFAHKKLG